MTPKSNVPDNRPLWSPAKTLNELRKLYTELQEIKAEGEKNPLAAYAKKERWTELTHSVVISGFGNPSEQLTSFNFAYYARRNRNEMEDFRLVNEKHDVMVSAGIRLLEMNIDDNSFESISTIPEKASQPRLAIFISHSSKDEDLAFALIQLLQAGLGLLPEQIRCTSVDGYRLPVGVNTEATLVAEVNAAEVLIGLITTNSLASTYVLFELGARWGAKQFLAPLFAGVPLDRVHGPLKELNALTCNSDSQLHQLLEDIGKRLGLAPRNPASYSRYIDKVRELSERPADKFAVAETGLKTPTHKKLALQLTIVGTTPSPQSLEVRANQVVKAIRMEYRLTSGVTLAMDSLDISGAVFEIPVNDSQILKLWNNPRSDRNHSDHSGPAVLKVSFEIGDEVVGYNLPIQMDAYFHGATMYRKLTGSETF